VAGDRLRIVISSIICWRKGLISASEISCLRGGFGVRIFTFEAG
jgi:hypothetical protein